ncbi:MAG: penicillin-binding protein 1C [Bacteroidales bacterium]|nr:penicillin-binding protein 1C [Bacteroidales bacterium]
MVAIIAFLVWFSLPKYPFDAPYSLVVTDSSGNLLGAKIASDGQWRFPQGDSVPYKFRECIVNFEDKRFQYHPGVDIFAIFRAAWLDIKNRKIVSGGSTITMQTVRLSRHQKGRTFMEKIIEAIQAVRLEVRYSKDEILQMYAAHAPFGGNTVGLETAAQRYFGRPAHTLSWSECAMLAVLPNNPSLIHLSRNRDALQAKRNALLNSLLESNIIDDETCELAKQEPLPTSPKPYPQAAQHLVERIAKRKSNYGKPVRTTIDLRLQNRTREILSRHARTLRTDGIYNGAVMIMEINTGNVIAYVGNTDAIEERDDGNDVDIIQAYRSTGSILKPFLYCAMLSEGELLPNTLIPDIPMQISGYMPKNYRLTYDGAVPANKALARSLNVPAVKMLQQYSGEKFIHILKKLKINSVGKPATHYGLSLILGGCEASLWELCGAYASMTRSLRNYLTHNNMYSPGDYHLPNFYYYNNHSKSTDLDAHSFLTAGAIYYTLKALTMVERPEDESSHASFGSDRIVSWKTGTSFGFRDAWAIGITGNYVVGVWTGNADGEGRPNIVGIKASAPILFDVIKLLPRSRQELSMPYDDLTSALICKKSGHIASENCPYTEEMLIPLAGINTQSCPYCQTIHLDPSEQYRVTADCESPENIVHRKWFVLPPAMEYYYKQHNSDYRVLPPMRPDCNRNADGDLPIQIIYPESNAKIFLPKGFEGDRQRIVIEATTRISGNRLFWHIDDNYISVTQDIHRISADLPAGRHLVTITDQNGNSVSRWFEVIDK